MEIILRRKRLAIIFGESLHLTRNWNSQMVGRSDLWPVGVLLLGNSALLASGVIVRCYDVLCTAKTGLWVAFS